MEIHRTQNSCSELFILLISSVFTEPWRIGVNNSAWQRKRRDEKIWDLWTKVHWQVWSRAKYNFWYLLRTWHLEIVCKKTFWAKHCPTKFSSQSCVKTLGLNIVYQPGWSTKLDLTRTTVMGNLFHHAENTHFRANPRSRVLQEHLLDQSLKFRSWNSWPILDLKLQLHRLTSMNRQPTLWLPEERIELWMKFTITKSNSDPAQIYSQHFTSQNLAWKKPTMAKGNLCSPCHKSIWQQGSSLCKQISSVLPIVHLYSKRLSFLRTKRSGYSRKFLVWRCLFESCIRNGYKDGTSLRSRTTRTWWVISLGYRKNGIAEGIWKTWSTKFIRKILDPDYSRRKQQEKKSWILGGSQKSFA